MVDPGRLERILDGLSETQKRAVLTNSRFVRIVAGAGAEKTETLTRRTAFLIAGGAQPESMVAFTLVEKAVVDNRNRMPSVEERAMQSPKKNGANPHACNNGHTTILSPRLYNLIVSMPEQMKPWLDEAAKTDDETVKKWFGLKPFMSLCCAVQGVDTH
ncbi:MAG: ATP-dependent helicase [Candidatus Fermentithermobacillus carboniphilus]|uniref:ATP-dependent helicase n=1 Tax=Candidatus Fermentithermobacillus carboniphilus TaxID=3085328 RepID=A0AAT9LE05_9FIRM|nr:MAG: ATP-dependent helicase [Candidatus Fermentithermobacillus carboniphilus]